METCNTYAQLSGKEPGCVTPRLRWHNGQIETHKVTQYSTEPESKQQSKRETYGHYMPGHVNVQPTDSELGWLRPVNIWEVLAGNAT